MILEVPSIFTDDIIKVSEFTLEDFRSISFMIENDSDLSLYNFFKNKIHTPCNALDKFNALFQARMRFVDDNILFNNGKSNITINLNVLKDAYISNVENIQKSITFEDFDIVLNYPKELLYDKFEDIMIDCIESLSYKDKTINFQNLSYEDANKIIERLHPGILIQIKEFVVESCNNKTILMESKLDLPELSINIFDNTAYNLLKVLYSYYNYDEIVELLFMLSKRISDIQFLNSRTPRDLDLFIKLYSEDIEKSNHEDKLTI